MGAGAVKLSSMTSKVGPKGQVVIPKDLRVQLGIVPGDEVTVWRDGDRVVLRRRGDAPPLKGRFRGRALIAELELERAQDRRLEDAR